MRGLASRDGPCARSNLLWDRRLSAPPATGSLLFDRRPPLSSDRASGPPLSNRRQLQVWAARKGDGKQQRKPKSAVKAEEPSPAQAPAAAKPPPRIGTTPLPGSLKQRLTFVKAVKEYTKKPVQPAPQTRSWRKPKQTADELKEQRQREEEQLKLTKKEANNFALRQIHDSTNDYRRKAVLLVDGYNVIGDRKDKNDKEENEGLLLPGQILEEERDRLIEDLADYSQKAGIRIIVAFDALRSGRQDNTEEVLSNGVTVVFCGACEADTYITAAVKRMLEKGYNLVAVASNDEMVRLVASAPTVHHAKYGKQMVHHISVRALKRDMDTTYRQGLKALADYNDDVYVGTAGRGSKLSDLAAMRQVLMRAAPTAAQAAGARRRREGAAATVPGRVAGQATRAQDSSSDKSAP